MTPEELEDIFIRSLDVPLSDSEKEKFLNDPGNSSSLMKRFEEHKKLRVILKSNESATFGPYFASKLISKIENNGVVIDRQIFAFFKKFQLAVMGILVAFLILNFVFADENTVTSVLGLDNTSTTNDQIVSFDFYETLNK